MIMDKNDFIVSKTDLKGCITYCNEIFMRFAGLSEKELLGKPHNIIRHADMPKIIFKLLWERIKQKQEIFAYVKNLSANGDPYWVYANITASVDEHNNIIGYYSVRRKPNERALDVIQDLYATLLQEEQRGGMNASALCLSKVLQEKNMNYDVFINHLQNA